MDESIANKISACRQEHDGDTIDGDTINSDTIDGDTIDGGRRLLTPWIHIPMIGRYRFRGLHDRHAAEQLARLTAEHGAAAFGRDPAIGHITGSAFLLSPDRTKTLLILHAKIGRWLQPGGHCDGETDVHATAWREAAEETGLPKDAITPIDRQIFDIDIHDLPALGGQPPHRRYDVRFLFEADPCVPIPGNHESTDQRWVSLKNLDHYSLDHSVLVVREAAATR